MMYERFYGLREKPFSLLPDPAYLYLSEKHQMAATLLEYAVTNQAGFSVITGEIGAGKTTLIRYLLDRLDRDTTVGLISNTHPSLGGLLRWVVLAFDLPGENHSLPDMYQRFVDYLIAQYAKGRRTVLIVDEAQNLAAETLEELRMLSNVNADKDQVLQTILVGQPGLRTTLRRPELAQFAQRIVVDFHLESLEPEETRAYIRHRLKVAGGSPEIFSDDACNAVHRYSRGSPRLINLICDMSLVYGFAEQSATVAESLVSDVVRDRQRLGCLPILADVPDPPLASARHAVAPISLASAAAMRTSLASASPAASTNEMPATTDKDSDTPASAHAAGRTPASDTVSATVTTAARTASPEPSVTVDVAEPEIVRLTASPATSYPPPSSAQPITVVPKSASGQTRSHRFHSLSVGVGFAAGAVLSIGIVAAFLLRSNPDSDPASEHLAAAGVAPAVAASAPVLASTAGNNGDTHPVATPATPADTTATQPVGGKDAAEAKTRERELQASLAASKAETERLRAEAALAATRAEAERLRGEASRAASKLEAERVRAEAALAAAQAETERLRSQAAAAAAAIPATSPTESAGTASGKKATTAKTASTANDAKPIFQSNPCKGVSARFLSTCND